MYAAWIYNAVTNELLRVEEVKTINIDDVYNIVITLCNGEIIKSTKKDLLNVLFGNGFTVEIMGKEYNIRII